MAINLDLAGKPTETFSADYDWRDCALYALGVGATIEELDYLNETSEFKVLPTFVIVQSFKVMHHLVLQLNVNRTMLLHGEQQIELHRPLPREGTIESVGQVTGIYDKSKAALAMIRVESRLGGELVAVNTYSIFCRGEGGFGGERGPSGERITIPADQEPVFKVTYQTAETQAALYRISSDLNPLHIDPRFAEKAGYEKPILHGLCTFGHVGRAVLHSLCASEPKNLRSLRARFSDVVFPGDQITTEGFALNDGRYALKVTTDRGKTILSNAVAEIETAV